MTWKDAATIATITAFTVWVLNFLSTAPYELIAADPQRFFFEAIRTYLVAWAGNFITLTGLEQYVKHKESGE